MNELVKSAKQETVNLSKQWDRRQFIRAGLTTSLVSPLIFLPSCVEKPSSLFPLNKKQYKLLVRIQDILFPRDDHGPGAIDFNADQYVLWMLSDTRMDQEIKEFFIAGFDKMDQKSMDESGKSFLKMNHGEQEALIEQSKTESWMENWLSLHLTYIIEAMISDPVYGFNQDETGWKWLGHQAGYPRPELHNRYDEIFQIFYF